MRDDLFPDIKKSLTDLADAISEETESFSFTDFNKIVNLKDRMIICASMLALRGAAPVSINERSMIDHVACEVEQLIQILKDVD